MYLAPLNYDRFFKKVFSEPDIAKKFLEDFLDTEIESLTPLKEKHTITDDATFVEFDFRCKIKNSYVIIDMQQWYKSDIGQRFYLYHALNTGLQLETLPKRKIVLDASAKQIKKVKDYRLLEPVYTIIWMVDDTLNFQHEDYVSYMMTPELVVKFIQKEKLWNKKDMKQLMLERSNIINLLSNNAKNIDFFSKNRLVFLFQKNIVNNNKIDKYARWFEFAEKTKNPDNTEDDFKEFQDEPPFDEMIRRLNRSELTDEDLDYIRQEKESWEEIKRYDMEHYEEGKKEGRKEGIEEGKKEGKKEAAKKLLSMKLLTVEQIAMATDLSINDIEQLKK